MCDAADLALLICTKKSKKIKKKKKGRCEYFFKKHKQNVRRNNNFLKFRLRKFFLRIFHHIRKISGLEQKHKAQSQLWIRNFRIFQDKHRQKIKCIERLCQEQKFKEC